MCGAAAPCLAPAHPGQLHAGVAHLQALIRRAAHNAAGHPLSAAAAAPPAAKAAALAATAAAAAGTGIALVGRPVVIDGHAVAVAVWDPAPCICGRAIQLPGCILLRASCAAGSFLVFLLVSNAVG